MSPYDPSPNMKGRIVVIDTCRTRLRCWQATDREAFATLNADPDVMRDLGGPISRAESDAKLDAYIAAFALYGLCHWALEGRDGTFLGYTGVKPQPPDHPLGAHFSIGWRLMRRAWGQGYATEAAQAALDDAFTRVRLDQVFAYTAPDNTASQAVMTRLGLTRDKARDFTVQDNRVGAWRGLVWVGRSTKATI